MFIPVKAVGSIGVIKDVSQNELAPNAWTDASNIRFLDGSAQQSFGHSEVYDTPPFAPHYLLQVTISGVEYWIYTTASKTYAVTNSGGTAVHTDITHATPRTGVVNQWTGCNFQGIPILNVGDTTHAPMYWDMNLANNFVDLPSWPANTYVKALRPYKSFLIGLNVTQGGTNYPHKVMWSTSADPGSLPASYTSLATNDAGDLPLAEGEGEIVDGLQLKDSFIIYKERSAHRMDYVGGDFIMSVKQIFGMSGVMNANCIAEFDGMHFVVTNHDVVIHDGYSAQSVLDRSAKRAFFQDIDDSYKHRVFVFKNPFLNEIYVAYPSIGATSCDKALVYNYKDKTVSYRSLPNLNHAAYGAVDNGLVNSFDADSEPVDSDLSTFNGPDYVPGAARVIMASADTKLFMLDASASFDGVLPDAYLERRALNLGDQTQRWLIKGVRPIIYGNVGQTVTVSVGGADDPFSEPTYTDMDYTIGSTISCDCFVNSRYPAIKFATGSAYTWRLDSYVLEAEPAGSW